MFKPLAKQFALESPRSYSRRYCWTAWLIVVILEKAFAQFCIDTNTLCPFWAHAPQEQQCDKNPAYMDANCPVSCRSKQCSTATLQIDNCTDLVPDCAGWAAAGECAKTPYWMLWKCPKSCKHCVKAGLVGYPYNLTDGMEDLASPEEQNDEVSENAVVLHPDDTAEPKAYAGFKLFAHYDCAHGKHEIFAGVSCEADAFDTLETCADNCQDDDECQGFVYSRHPHATAAYISKNFPVCDALCVEKNFTCQHGDGSLTKSDFYHWYLKVEENDDELLEGEEPAGSEERSQ